MRTRIALRTPSRDRPGRAAFALLVFATLLAGAVAPGSSSAAERPIALGMYAFGVPERPAVIDRYAELTGRQPAIIHSYRYWGAHPFSAGDLRTVDDRGAVPLVSWEPWNSNGEGASLRAIARGRYDRYVRRCARQAARWEKPILLRFAHEMNGDWIPWGVQANTPRDYTRAWRHLVKVFRAQGAKNVRWVWSPNVDPNNIRPFEQLYPGDRWVDWVGLDGFNWGGGLGWRSFTEIYASSYKHMIRLTRKPLMIAEVSSAEQAHRSKSEWITSMFERELAQFPSIRAIVWFNRRHDEADFRVQSSREAQAAFRSAIDGPEFSGEVDEVVNPRSSQPPPPGSITIPSGGYGEPSLLTRTREELGERKSWVVAAMVGMLVGFVVWLVVWLRGR